MPDALSTSGLIAGIVSIVLAVIAIAISLYFYTQGKNTESRISGLLEAIRAQTDMLQKIVGRQMDRLIRGVTEQPHTDYTAVTEMIGAIKDIPTTVITLLQAPTSSAQATQAWRRSAIDGYIGAYYYAAISNISNQCFLPPLESLETENIIKKVLDTSFADFTNLDRWFPTLDQQELRLSPVFHLYQEAFSTWRQFVKDSTGVYAERAASAASGQVGHPSSGH